MLTLEDLRKYMVFISTEKKKLSEEMLAIMEGTKLIIYDRFYFCSN